MKNPARVLGEIELLSTHYGEIVFDPNDPSVVLIERFWLPPEFDRSYCRVLIDLGPRYPELPPQDYYLGRDLRKNGRASIHYFESFPGKEYCEEGFAWYSFHIKEWRPDPYSMVGGDNLLTATDGFYHALKTD